MNSWDTLSQLFFSTKRMETLELKLKEPINLESGQQLHEATISFWTAGKLNTEKNNVVWVCHALTANANVSEWWPNMVGPGLLLDTDRYYIICANILGSCYGTTGPLSINPLTSENYFKEFPFISIRDMARLHQTLANHLEISEINLLIGASLGGQQALEWAIENPTFIKKLTLIATNAQHSPWGIAFNEAQRLAIEADPTFGKPFPEAGQRGLKAARATALLSYRNYYAFKQTQSESSNAITDNFLASSYQQYQGEKLVKRFNAYSYYTLSKAMDSHNVGRNRGGVEQALKKILAKTLVIGIKSDFLFPISEQKFLARWITNASFAEIESHYGHDGFLVDTEKITVCINEFLREVKEKIATIDYRIFQTSNQ